MYSYARRHKAHAIKEGDIGKDTVWDRPVFDRASSKVLRRLGATLDRVIVTQGAFGSGPRSLSGVPFSSRSRKHVAR